MHQLCRFLTASLSATLFSSLTLANPAFNTPPPPGPNGDYSLDPIYNESSTLEISWANAGFSRSNLVLYQAVSGIDFTLASNISDTSYNWTVTWKNFRNLSNYENGEMIPAYIMYLQVFDADNNANTFSSHYFNISDQASFPSVAANVSPSSSSPTATASATSTISQATSSPLAQNSSSSDSLSGGVKAGIGIGAIVGVFALAGAGFAAFALGQRRAAAQWKKGGSANPVNELSNTEVKRSWWGGSVSSGSSGSMTTAAATAHAPGCAASSHSHQPSGGLGPSPSSHYPAAELASGGRYHSGAAHEVNGGVSYYEMPAQQQRNS